MIVTDVKDIPKDRPIILTSGGFDPIHIGHIEYLVAARKLNYHYTLVVAVNGDGFLKRKKQYSFYEENKRAKIVDNIKGVEYTIVWDDGTQYVDGLIRLLKPQIFAKGGDRDCDAAMPICEVVAATEVGTTIIYGVGGKEKLDSSSELVDNYKKLQT